jgi:ABC-type amino acid transport substrate-binding protein
MKKVFKPIVASLVLAATIIAMPSYTFALDEFGTSGVIPGVSFSGGDGSYDRAVKDGLVVAITPHIPYTYQDNSGQPAGMDVEIIKDAARRVGITNLKFELMQFDSLIPSLVAKRVDIVADNLHVNPERIKVIAFTGPSYFYGGAIAVQKGNPKKISTWDDLAGKSVGYLRGGFWASIIEKRKDLSGTQPYATSAVQFADLATGRVDAIMDDDTAILAFIKENPNIGIELAKVTLPASEQLGYARYAVRKEDLTLNAAFSRALAEMRADGTIKKLLPIAGLPATNIFSYSLDE